MERKKDTDDRKRIIPFRFLPAAWGLEGKSRKIAEAEYNLSGRSLELELIKIDYDYEDCPDSRIGEARVNYKYGMINEDELELIYALNSFDKDPCERTDIMQLEAMLKNNKITEKEHDYGVAKYREDNGQTMLAVQHKHGEISDNDFGKAMANIRGEPWVIYNEIEVSKENGDIISFELDWNDKFIELIRLEGHDGASDEDCVDLWLTKVSRSLALETLDGTGAFTEESDHSYELKKKKLDGGKSEYT